MIEYDVKQIHLLVLTGDTGDYENPSKFVSIKEGFKYLKSSTKGRLILDKLNFGKFVLDKEKTDEFRKSLSTGVTGIVLKRTFPKLDKEEYYTETIYSIWLYCQKKEISEEKDVTLSLDFDPLSITWDGVEQNLNHDSNIKVTSTPLFLIKTNKTATYNNNSNYSTFKVYLLFVFMILLV